MIAVGASESAKTRTKISSVMDFSNCGTTDRLVDVVVPGKSIVSRRAPGSNADVNYPQARVANRLFLGSGTSQSAAVVSGMAALILSERPNATPDQVKALLMGSTFTIRKASTQCQGAGVPVLDKIMTAATPQTVQLFAPATGTGTLEAARGSSHVADNGICSGRRAGHLRNRLGRGVVVGFGRGECVVVGWRLERLYLDRCLVEQRFVEWCFLVECLVVRRFVE